jgi:hypothetical protein
LRDKEGKFRIPQLSPNYELICGVSRVSRVSRVVCGGGYN